MYQSMEEIALDLKQLIDEYWKLSVSENMFRDKVESLFSEASNRGLIMRGRSFKAGFERKLGKKRIIELKQILLQIDGELYKGLLER